MTTFSEFEAVQDAAPREVATPSGRGWAVLPTALPLRFAGVELVKSKISLLRDETHFLDREDLSLEARLSSLPAHAKKAGALLRAVSDTDQLRRFQIRDGFVLYRARRYPQYLLDLRLGVDAVLAGLSSKTRSTLKRKINKLEKTFGEKLRYDSFSNAQDIRGFLERAAPLSRKTYQHRLLNAGLPEQPSFADEMSALAEHGSVRGWMLSVEDVPVAYLLCPARGGIMSYDYVGYDPDYAKHSVGLALQWFALKELLHEHQFAWFDFTPGDGQHKSMFASECHQLADIYAAPLFSKATMLMTAHCALEKIETALTSVADRLGVKTWIKKALR